MTSRTSKKPAAPPYAFRVTERVVLVVQWQLDDNQRDVPGTRVLALDPHRLPDLLIVSRRRGHGPFRHLTPKEARFLSDVANAAAWDEVAADDIANGESPCPFADFLDDYEVDWHLQLIEEVVG